MRKFILTQLFAVLVLSVFLSHAQAQCQGSGTRIYFGNGMFNSVADANASLYELKKLVVDGLESNTNRIHYDLALNVSETDLDNILTVIAQRANGDITYFWNVMDAVIPMPDWLVKPITDTMDSFRDLSTLDGDTLERMVEQYQASLMASEKILLVSHSQGNFYAEEALNRVLRKKQRSDPFAMGFGNVRVATPTPTRFSFPYFTFQGDQIIQWVAALIGAPQPNLFGIASGPGPFLDPLGHNFILAYLHNGESALKIQTAMSEIARRTAYPCE